jgi:hypothetical protein
MIFFINFNIFIFFIYFFYFVDKKMEEWKINENKVLESLNEIATAKRVATMVIFLIHVIII